MLRRSPERSGRRHGLIDLVGERRRHPAHQVDPRNLGGFRLPFNKTCLGIASNSIGVLAFADDDTNDEPGHCQNQHQSLEFGEFACMYPETCRSPMRLN